MGIETHAIANIENSSDRHRVVRVSEGGDGDHVRCRGLALRIDRFGVGGR